MPNQVFIIKTAKKSYAMIRNDLLANSELSWKAKGILCYLVSKPNDWKVQVNDIIAHGRDGSEAVRSAIKELIDNGFIRLEKRTDEKGRFAGVFHYVSDTAEFKTCPHAENPDADNPDAENRHLTKTDLTKTENTKTNTYTTQPTEDGSLCEAEEVLLKVEDIPRKRKATAFKPPTLEELTYLCDKEQLEYTDPKEFFYFYEKKGWMVGKSRMKCWKSAARGWDHRNKTDHKPKVKEVKWS